MNMQNPEELLEQLCQKADPRKTKSLRLIFDICKEQNARGSKDYSVATIGRLSSERGGPAAGAIRNPTGLGYRALIQAYADSVGGQKKKQGVQESDPIDQVLQGNNNPVLRTRIHLLLAELECLRGQLNAARHLANQKTTLALGSPAMIPESAPQPLAGGLSLSPTEKRTLQKAIAKETLDNWGWKVDDSGRVTSENGQPVFGPGFTTALAKILKFLQ